MKRRFYILIIVLSFGIIVNAQNSNDELGFEMEMDSTIIGKDMCETAKNMAKRDIVNGRYAAFFHGYRGNNSQTFERLMVRKYGVYASRTGLCSGDEFLSCYSKISIPIIKEKFGEDIFEKTRLEAIELDKQGKGDRDARHEKGWSEFVKFFYCELDNEFIKQYKSKKDYPAPTLTLNVNKEGKIYDSTIEFCEDEKVEKEINRIINKLPKIQPATEDGKAIEDKIIFCLHVNRKWKKKTCH